MAQKSFRDSLISALVSGGDSRLALDPRTGMNKYLCPAAPAPGLVGAASCTASPISLRGLARAADIFGAYAGATSLAARKKFLADRALDIRGVLPRSFGVADLAEVILCPSGTDALLTSACLIAAERPDMEITAVLPCAAETGTGVPLAAACRHFDGPMMGQKVIACDARTVEIPLRDEDGAPLSEDAVNASFALAAARAPGRSVVFLTHGTKTGLIAPTEIPPGVDVIVDACQARIAAACVADYLRRGWPVVVTGSKFFGGPAFSGAVFYPKARLTGTVPSADGENLGTILRWTAALESIQAFRSASDDMAGLLARRGAAIQRAIDANPALVAIPGRVGDGTHWADVPSIFTFAVRDPADDRRLLSMAALKPVHAELAGDGILLGQPVGLGAFGGLRIALGARDLLDTAAPENFARLLDVVERLDPSCLVGEKPAWREVVPAGLSSAVHAYPAVARAG